MSEPVPATAATQAASDYAIEAINVVKHFDGGIVRALDGVTLRVRPGESVAITGPSGCGKSTLLHLLAKLDSPTSGTIRVDGIDLSTLSDPSDYRRTTVGLVFQLHNLLPHLSAVRNVEIAMFGTHLSRGERHERALQLLAAVDLAGRENRPPTKLSGGERQRVAIARSLANDPPILLADEPTGSLDEKSVDHVLSLFQRLRQDAPSLCILMVTHDARVAQSCDRIVRMRDGRVVDEPNTPTPVATI